MVSPNEKKSQPSYCPTLELLEARRVLASISGFAFVDSNQNLDFDSGEPALVGAQLFIDSNGNGVPDLTGMHFDPDTHQTDEVIDRVRNDIFASTTGIDNVPQERVTGRASSRASTGLRVFGNDDGDVWESDRRLRFDFASLAESVAIDVTGAATSSTIRLDAFSDAGELVERVTLDAVRRSRSDVLEIQRPQADIRYVVAYVTNQLGAATFDNLRVDAAASEMMTVAGTGGFYRFADLTRGTYRIVQMDVEGYNQTTPDRVREISAGPQSVSRINFSNQTHVLEGVVFDDRGTLGTYEVGTDVGVENAAVFLDTDRDGAPDTASISLPPTVFAEGQVLDNELDQVTLTVVDETNQPVTGERVTATSRSTSKKVFAHEADSTWNNERRLRVDFETPASEVAIDFLGGNPERRERGILLAYNIHDEVVDTAITNSLDAGMRETMRIARPGHDIAYVVAHTFESDAGAGRLDVLVATFIDEPVAFTNADGEFEFSPLASGNYRIAKVPVDGQTQTFPADLIYEETLFDGQVASDLLFGIVEMNQPPIARGDAVVMTEDVAQIIDVLANDEDPDGILTRGSITIVRHPSHGSVTVNAAGELEYAPESDFVGSDTFLYAVQDNQGAVSNNATVAITVTPVNDRPTATDDVARTIQDTPTEIGVLGNDVDIDSALDLTSVSITTQPSQGAALVDESTGTITYVPNEGFVGVDMLTYTVQDEEGLVSDTATVRVVVVSAGSAPTAADDVASTLEGTQVNIEVTGNDRDEDGEIVSSSVIITEQPSHGTVSIDPATGVATYRPQLGFVGDDSFRYRVRDNSGLSSDEAQVVISIAEREFPFQNPISALDVNGDGFIVPRDALLVIGEINSRLISDPSGKIVTRPEAPNRPANYFDVTGDGFVVAGDVLQIINHLNRPEPVAATADGDQLHAVAAAFADFDRESDEQDA